jgi:hypothetical protein
MDVQECRVTGKVVKHLAGLPVKFIVTWNIPKETFVGQAS